MAMAYATRPESSLTSVRRNAFSEKEKLKKRHLFI
jgi:hypothetical protein